MFLFCCIFLLAAQGCLAGDEVLPNIGFLLRGYHLYHGNPLATQVTADPGFQSLIFEPTYEQDLLSSDLKYRIPDGTKAYSKEACTQAFSNDVIETADQYQRMLKEMVKTNYTGFDHTFSGSGDYRAVHSAQAEDTTAQLLLTQYLCVKYEVVLNPASPPTLSPIFVDHVRELYNQYNKLLQKDKDNTDSIYLVIHNFINVFGTHYVKSMDMGSRYSHQSTVRSMDRHELEQVGLDMKTGAVLSMTRKMGHVLTEDEVRRSLLFDQIVTDTKSSSSFSHNQDGTLNTTNTKPLPLYYEVDRIDKLFVKKYLKSAGVDYKKLNTLFAQYFLNYCANEKRYSGEDRCGENVYNVLRTASQNNFKVQFPANGAGSSANCVIWKHKLNIMNSLTVSWWMKTPPYVQGTKKRRVVLSYNSLTNGYSTDHFKIRVSTETEGGCVAVLIDNEEVKNGNVNYCLIPVDNTYHHYVFTWSNVYGRWQLYIDGNVMSGGSQGRTYVIPAGGYLAIGQEHAAGIVIQNRSTAFVGEIAYLNIWNFYVNGVEARKLAADNGLVEGNIAAWDQTQLKTNGDTVVFQPITSNDEFFKA